MQSGRKIQRLTVDIMIFSGDVNFNCYDEYSNDLKDVQISYDKYYLSNKIFFNVNLGQHLIHSLPFNMEFIVIIKINWKKLYHPVKVI